MEKSGGKNKYSWTRDKNIIEENFSFALLYLSEHFRHICLFEKNICKHKARSMQAQSLDLSKRPRVQGPRH